MLSISYIRNRVNILLWRLKVNGDNGALKKGPGWGHSEFDLRAESIDKQNDVYYCRRQDLYDTVPYKASKTTGVRSTQTLQRNIDHRRIQKIPSEVGGGPDNIFPFLVINVFHRGPYLYF